MLVGLWVISAGLWLANVNRAKEATHGMITEMAEASPHWLAKIQDSWRGTRRPRSTIAIVLAILSLAVAIGVWTPLRWPALAVGIVLSLAYWLYGQTSADHSGAKARPTSTQVHCSCCSPVRYSRSHSTLAPQNPRLPTHVVLQSKRREQAWPDHYDTRSGCKSRTVG